MTEKRFTVKQRQGATNYSIIDYYGQLPLSEGIYYKSNAEKLCNWLNEQHELLNALHEENQLLKEEKELLKNKLDRIKDILPHFLSCAEISEFHSKTFKEDIALMKCWNKRYQK